MPACSRASSSATRPWSRSPARASRPPAACPTSARPAASGSASTPWSTAMSTCSRRDPARVWQCWAEPLVGARHPAESRARRARAARGGRLHRGRRHAEHRRPAPRRRQRRGRGARAPAHAPRCLRCGAEEDMAPALARYARQRAGAGVPRLRRHTATAGRALRRAAARLGLGSRAHCSRRTRAAACASAPRCRSTRRPAWPRRSCTRAGRSRSSRSSRPSSGTRPIRACCARPRSSCRGRGLLAA